MVRMRKPIMGVCCAGGGVKMCSLRKCACAAWACARGQHPMGVLMGVVRMHTRHGTCAGGVASVGQVVPPAHVFR
jgi:hypothetical protein